MVILVAWVVVALKWLIRSTLWILLILVLLMLLIIVGHLPLAWFIVSKRAFRAVIILAVVVEVGRIRIFIIFVVTVTI